MSCIFYGKNHLMVMKTSRIHNGIYWSLWISIQESKIIHRTILYSQLIHLFKLYNRIYREWNHFMTLSFVVSTHPINQPIELYHFVFICLFFMVKYARLVFLNEHSLNTSFNVNFFKFLLAILFISLHT